MMTSFWLMWLVFMCVFFILPVGYGAAYRGWGMPSPRYFQRRRTLRGGAVAGAVTRNHEAWGWSGDYVWIILVVGVFWASTALWWR